MEPFYSLSDYSPVQEHQPQVHQEFSWEILSCILEGKSPIDLSSLSLKNRDEAQRLVSSYGYNLDNPDERKILQAMFGEAVKFIKTYFCDGTAYHPEPYTMPSDMERIADVRDLLVWASSHQNAEHQAWSCAILRVMHTINHIDNTMRVEFFPEIKRQILNRFKQNIHEDEHGQPVLGTGPLAIPLCGVFYKEEKSRDSLIMKLLHKEKNVAENIHDRLGVKIVTATKLDALRTLSYLWQNLIILFTNLTPGRSRNLLIDLNRYHDVFEQCTAGKQELSEDELERRFQEIISSPEAAQLLEKDCPTSSHSCNAFSSPDYQSIQFTVQQSVKLENPGYFKARRLRVQLEKYHLGPDMEGLLRELEGPGADHEIRMLFPLEVQIIDKENYAKSIEGSASHDEYKKRQLKAACDRVMFAVHRLRKTSY